MRFDEYEPELLPYLVALRESRKLTCFFYGIFPLLFLLFANAFTGTLRGVVEGDRALSPWAGLVLLCIPLGVGLGWKCHSATAVLIQRANTLLKSATPVEMWVTVAEGNPQLNISPINDVTWFSNPPYCAVVRTDPGINLKEATVYPLLRPKRVYKVLEVQDELCKVYTDGKADGSVVIRTSAGVLINA